MLPTKYSAPTARQARIGGGLEDSDDQARILFQGRNGRGQLNLRTSSTITTSKIGRTYSTAVSIRRACVRTALLMSRVRDDIRLRQL